MELSSRYFTGSHDGNRAMKKRPFNSILAVLILTVAPAAALGQSKLDPGALPKSTTFYLAWHGTPCGDARKANSLLALWDDADFAPLRDSMFEAILRQSPTSKRTPSALNQEELREYASLLDNEFIVGYIGNPHPPEAAPARRQLPPPARGTECSSRMTVPEKKQRWPSCCCERGPAKRILRTFPQ